MKLAEALMERKEIKERMEALKKRLYGSARVEEGAVPTEPPGVMLDALLDDVTRFERLVARIHRTNATALFDDGESLSDALIHKDMLRFRHLVLTGLADHAVTKEIRYSARELRMVPTVDVAAIRRRADEHARQARLLDARIQRLNWTAELT